MLGTEASSASPSRWGRASSRSTLPRESAPSPTIVGAAAPGAAASLSSAAAIAMSMSPWIPGRREPSMPSKLEPLWYRGDAWPSPTLEPLSYHFLSSALSSLATLPPWCGCRSPTCWGASPGSAAPSFSSPIEGISASLCSAVRCGLTRARFSPPSACSCAADIAGTTLGSSEAGTVLMTPSTSPGASAGRRLPTARASRASISGMMASSWEEVSLGSSALSSASGSSSSSPASWLGVIFSRSPSDIPGSRGRSCAGVSDRTAGTAAGSSRGAAVGSSRGVAVGSSRGMATGEGVAATHPGESSGEAGGVDAGLATATALATSSDSGGYARGKVYCFPDFSHLLLQSKRQLATVTRLVTSTCLSCQSLSSPLPSWVTLTANGAPISWSPGQDTLKRAVLPFWKGLGS
mmetsp:Transcript_26917/g.86469  ORF Transcript_26917/g.86469 Transcript_26917/m.86469 type:complete len:407 (-) Transcript_26917:210-1430(-)